MSSVTKQPLNKNSYGRTIEDIIMLSGMSQAAFCRTYGIPKSTIQDWLNANRRPPIYVLDLLDFKVCSDSKNTER